ncbi:MAG TPA: DUF5060 domain-containing protein [Bacteroidales bacterium]|nr:DUF5060 domain-containing protein [Bacteroidales bacterium]
MKRIIPIAFIVLVSASIAASTVEQYSVFELALKGPSTGNPFKEVQLTAEFKFMNRTFLCEGFYDGDGIYKVRFMPDEPGVWTYTTTSNKKELDSKNGTFTCTPHAQDNHGPMRVRNTFDFGYADGTPFYPVGTTCYAWVHQPDDLVQQTLAALSDTKFNKIRMTVMPKNYDVYINNEPPFYPFEGSKEAGWDFSRPNPAFFRNFENKIVDLQKLGIEADVILFHPYDAGKWNLDKMNSDQAVFYLRYLIARIAAYRNVWWSMANEYDIMRKTDEEWEMYFRVIQTYDPFAHLCSIHNGMAWYNHSKPWISHLSIQTAYLQDIQDWRELYGKPVIIDECVYEGNIPNDWGNLTPEEMVNRFWISWCRGAYCTHGETYLHPENILWWSKGGKLYGKSPERIAFLLQIMTETPTEGVYPLHSIWNKETYLIKDNEFYLHYYGNSQQAKARIFLPKDITFTLEIIDAWNMTVTPVPGEFSGMTEIPLPGIPYMAVRARSIIK